MSHEPRLHTVTGATGYTGRYITSLLLEQGHHVQSITGHPDRPSSFGDRVKLHPFSFDDTQPCSTLWKAPTPYSTPTGSGPATRAAATSSA